MYAFANGVSMVKKPRCEFDIMLLQEYWLFKYDFYKLGSIDRNCAFCSASDISYKASLNIVYCSPFSGMPFIGERVCPSMSVL